MGVSFETFSRQHVQGRPCLCPGGCLLCGRPPRLWCPSSSSLQGGEAPPPAFAYEYGVNDDYSKANFKKTETQDANGVVAGSYVIALPDGRIQTTKYTADHVNGFVAEVSYEGTPVYPPEPAEGYGHAAPVAAYAPAPPVYKPAA